MPGVLQFFGGLALFLYGMYSLGEGLGRLDNGRLEGVLGRLCSTPFRGVLLGALITAALQSSSATTVMVVGLVNVGVMTLMQAVGVIMGANLGTTLTAWILSLAGVSGKTPLLTLLKPTSLSSLLLGAGVVMILLKKEKIKNAGIGLVGFGVLFLGMEQMSAAVKPLAEQPSFVRLLTLFENPIAGLLAGALLTAVIQSSSAAVGILQALSATGSVSVAMAVPIVMGQNIGTCVTALLASVGTGKNAKCAAMIHLYFNVGGAAMLLLVFLLLKRFSLSWLDGAVGESDIAMIHTGFNILSILLLLPFAGSLVRLAQRSAGQKAAEGRFLEK